MRCFTCHGSLHHANNSSARHYDSVNVKICHISLSGIISIHMSSASRGRSCVSSTSLLTTALGYRSAYMPSSHRRLMQLARLSWAVVTTTRYAILQKTSFTLPRPHSSPGFCPSSAHVPTEPLTCVQRITEMDVLSSPRGRDCCGLRIRCTGNRRRTDSWRCRRRKTPRTGMIRRRSRLLKASVRRWRPTVHPMGFEGP